MQLLIEVRVQIIELSAYQVWGGNEFAFWHPGRKCHPRGPVLEMKQLNVLSPAAKMLLLNVSFLNRIHITYRIQQLSNAAGPHSVFSLINMFLPPKTSH